MVGSSRRREAVKGGAHTGLHCVYINTCPVHGEVHNNDM